VVRCPNRNRRRHIEYWIAAEARTQLQTNLIFDSFLCIFILFYEKKEIRIHDSSMHISKSLCLLLSFDNLSFS
jgi:hypothetical protein